METQHQQQSPKKIIIGLFISSLVFLIPALVITFLNGGNCFINSSCNFFDDSTGFVNSLFSLVLIGFSLLSTTVYLILIKTKTSITRSAVYSTLSPIVLILIVMIIGMFFGRRKAITPIEVKQVMTSGNPSEPLQPIIISKPLQDSVQIKNQN